MATVLLVEDDPGVREGLELALRRLGYRVHAAASGEAALSAISEAMVDVVVLDVMLPGLDGFEVCRRLRRSSDIPVIMLTARGDDLDIVGGLEAGADDYVVKPAEPRVLDARIRAVLPGWPGPAPTPGHRRAVAVPVPGGRVAKLADPSVVLRA
jgi:DNA-binding response OmpR family regulator